MMLNDLCMKIFEAYNDAQRPFIPGKDTEIYARNIYDAYDLRYIYEYNLQDLLIKVPSYIPSTKAVLLPYYKTSNQLSGANTSMGKSWEDHHIDNYHTEVRTRTVTDADGESHIETYTEEVYDDTTHKYDYDKKEGER
ncbi:MAG: hypothetical protein LBD11_03085 [Candidatus Peribacteria bacterium]|jgi:hypothetical protein|nr:hypothetical protein [Candidatus Peribacteria bacterium]